MKLSQRILSLERIAEDSEMPIPAIILFQYGGAFTGEQLQEITEAKNEGRPVIAFRVVDASIAEEI
jgi:hypothetical protein